MENRSKKLTFDEIENCDLENFENNKSSDALVNLNYWSKQEFQSIYFKRNNKFSSNELELKKEFENWHKETGLKYYNPLKQSFIIKNLPLKQKMKSSSELINFLLKHPLLDNKDKKHIMTIVQKQKDLFFRNSVLNTILGILVMFSILKRQAKIQKQPISKITRKYFLHSITIFTLSIMLLDISFRKNNHKLLTNYLYEHKMIDKYFQNYLI